MLRQQLNDALKESMKAKQSRAVLPPGLFAALKDRTSPTARTALMMRTSVKTKFLQLLQSMIKQRRDSIDAYLKGGRQELADGEAEEIKIIQRFLPKQMDDDVMAEAVAHYRGSWCF